VATFIARAEANAAKKLVLELKSGPDEISFDFEAQDTDAGKVLGGWLGISGLSGSMDLSFSGSGQAKSAAQFISTLYGSFDVKAKELTAQFADVDALLAGSGGGWGTGNGKPIAVSLQGKIKDGIAQLQKSAIGIFTPTGEIDLLRQAFEVTINKKTFLNGHWANPIVAPVARKVPDN
jgi:hypothetical protein